jgi:hypothetical protein
MKHSYIGSTFLDASSSAFFLSCRSDWREVPAGTASLPRPATTIKPVDESRGDMATSCGGSGVSDSTPRSRMCGSALGPQWVRDVAAAGDTSQGAAQVLIAKGADCLAYCSQGSGWHSVLDGSALAAPPATCSTDDDDRDPWPLRVLLSTGLQCGVDFVVRGPCRVVSAAPRVHVTHACVQVSATGVTPATAFLDDSFVRDSEGALVVTESMLCVGAWLFIGAFLRRRLCPSLGVHVGHVAIFIHVQENQACTALATRRVFPGRSRRRGSRCGCGGRRGSPPSTPRSA